MLSNAFDPGECNNSRAAAAAARALRVFIFVFMVDVNRELLHEIAQGPRLHVSMADSQVHHDDIKSFAATRAFEEGPTPPHCSLLTLARS